ncbi:glycosyltransferase [Rhizorhabdus argentea]|uniref:glycosyltransferase n=1 Tax=Rhizorhabdus argentea TaxID=1387174 RepID=UPI0030ED3D8C
MSKNLIPYLAMTLSVVAAVMLHVWIRLNVEVIAPLAPTVKSRLASVSYNPSSSAFDSFDSSAAQNPTILKEIDDDLREVARFSHRVRTYGVGGELADIPRIAARYGLQVDLGIDVHKGMPEQTRREVERAIAVARAAPNVRLIYVGNETLVRNEVRPSELAALMREVRQRSGKPVTTGETWDNWMNNPELASAADVISAHILPYWEGVPADAAIAAAFDHYAALSRRFPHKSITIGEFGWPSRGLNYRGAVPGLQTEARLLRSFADIAAKRHIDYNIVEAKDQPWKSNEGGVGQNWGILYGDNLPKFLWNGAAPVDPYREIKLVLGILTGLVTVMFIFNVDRPTLLQAIVSGPLSQAIGYGAATMFLSLFDYYLGLPQLLSTLLFLPLLGILVLLVADRVREASQRLLGAAPVQLLRQDYPVGLAGIPFVSIHVPICNEMYDVVRQTLSSLARIDWKNYEVLVILNNYSDRSLVKRVAYLCKHLGPRFILVDLEKVEGFKAGALNRALDSMSPQASLIGIVDADYVVDPAWLRHTVKAFAAADVASVQVPQDHRAIGRHWWDVGMNAEYGSFFDVGMVQRNEHNAIISHGTMLLVRRSAFEQVGRWDESCITEDTELGLRLLLAGWRNIYTTTRFGAGLLPDDLPAYRRQRFRWAFGAMGILRKHWRAILSVKSPLTIGQRYHFLAGWAHWIGDGIFFILSVLGVIWAAALAIFGIGLPPPAVISGAVLLLAASSLGHGVLIQLSRPGVSLATSLKSAIMSMTLQMPVGLAVTRAFGRHKHPFVVTAKGRDIQTDVKRSLAELRPDAFLAAAQILAAMSLVATNRQRAIDIDLFALTLACQSLPYASAVAVGIAQVWSARQKSLVVREALL